MGICDFSGTSIESFVHECKEMEYTLWLRHTEHYSLINAYNLAVMATLAYSDVRTDKENGDRDFKDFLGKLANKQKLRVFKKENKEETTAVNQFVKEVRKGDGIDNDNSGYMIDKATSTQAFWFTDKEKAVLAVRGTQEIDKDIILSSLLKGEGRAPDDAVIDLDAKQVYMSGIQGQVHRGFRTQAEAITHNPSFGNFMSAIQGKKLFIAGHSLGGAVATILAAYLKEMGFDPLLYTYGSPRVGDEEFVKAYADIVHYRHVYRHDVVPLVPGRNLDLGIPELRLCIVRGVTGGIMSAESTLSYLSRALILCGKNWRGPGYYHHGTLCQIVRAGNGSIMTPLFSHGIVAERIKRLLKKHKEAVENLERVKHERVDTDRDGISTPLEWWRHYRRVGKAEDMVEDTEDALSSLPDDRNDDYSLAAVLKGEISDHFMSEGYLPFLAQEIKTEWEFFKRNNCRNEALEKSPSSILYSRIERAIKRCEREIAEYEESIKCYEKAIDDQKRAGRLDMITSAEKGMSIQKRLLKMTRSDLERLRRMMKEPKGSFTLYGLHRSELELNRQLDEFS